MKTKRILYILILAQGIYTWMADLRAQSFSNDYRLATFEKSATGESIKAGQMIGLYDKPADFNIVDAGLDNTVKEAWVKRYNGPGNLSDAAVAVALDDSGNVYVTGTSDEGTGNHYDYVTIKYNASAEEQWIARYNGPLNGMDAACDIAVDRSGNVYVTGQSPGIGTSLDYATVKYSPSGQELWIARYDSLKRYDEVTALALDSKGNVFVTGASYCAGEAAYDYVTVKYNNEGEELWTGCYSNTRDEDRPLAIAVDGSDNVIVTGQSHGDGYTPKSWTAS
ncbi:MAG: SBBP repeat-containing protein [Bacteroidales bacterium]|nr:SBBP repeat-containing protein [Bacteroidales bacterium]